MRCRYSARSIPVGRTGSMLRQWSAISGSKGSVLLSSEATGSKDEQKSCFLDASKECLPLAEKKIPTSRHNCILKHGPTALIA